MARPRPRLTVQRAMLAVAAVATCLALTRDLPAVGVFLAGVLLLALARTWEALDRAQAKGRPLPSEVVPGLFLGSVGVASTLTALAVFLFFGVWIVVEVTLGTLPQGRISPEARILGPTSGVVAAVWIVSELRKTLWGRYVRHRPERRRSVGPGGRKQRL